MTAVAFDTHAAVTALRKAGFDEPQAEAAVAMVRDAVTEGVATKGDVDRLHTKMEAVETKIEAVETKIEALDTKIEAVETKIEAVETKIEAVDTKIEALDTKIEAVETKMDAGFAALKWVVGIVAALTIAIAARQFGAI